MVQQFKRVLILCLVLGYGLTINSCSSDDSNEICVSFDERQCNTDEWNANVGDGGELSTRIMNYLNSLDIEVSQIQIDEDFHEFVCEACDVCPTGPRIFISIDSSDYERISGLRLLSLETVTCNSVF